MEKTYFVKLLKQVKFWCNSPRSVSYRDYGARGIKCLFKRPAQIERLYIRDNAQAMNQPILSRRNRKRHFSPRNCCFEEVNDIYRRLEKIKMDKMAKSFQKEEVRRKLLLERLQKRREAKLLANYDLRHENELKTSVNDSIKPIMNTKSQVEVKYYG